MTEGNNIPVYFGSLKEGEVYLQIQYTRGRLPFSQGSAEENGNNCLYHDMATSFQRNF